MRDVVCTIVTCLGLTVYVIIVIAFFTIHIDSSQIAVVQGQAVIENDTADIKSNIYTKMFEETKALREYRGSESEITETDAETEATSGQDSADTTEPEEPVVTEPDPEPEPEPVQETEPEPVVEDNIAVASGTYYGEIPLSEYLQGVVFEAASDYDVSAALILAIIEVESDFSETVESSSGCYGLMQLNPSSFGYGLSSADNIRTGTAHISELISEYGDTHMALVAYNCGRTGARRKYFDNGEYTSSYSRKVVDKMSYWESIIS